MEEKEQLARIEEKINAITENLNRVIDKQEKYDSEANTKFAGKWVEKFIIPTIILIISLFISNIVK